jgi:predicted DsbA family dithiol-disulfide isomerase
MFPFSFAHPIFSFELEENPMLASIPDLENALPIDVVSDVVCPWCFIGKRRLEKAIALRSEISVTVRYRPYFLNPWVPRAGISRTEYLTTKFGSVDRYKANAQRIVMAARQEGLTYNLDAIARQPNTIDCHRLILWSGESGDPAHMKQRLMELYFTEGADLSDSEVLVGAARDCGMDADRVRERLAGEEDVETVSAEAEQAKAAGIDGVPCFILGGVFAVSGAQAPGYLADAIERAAAERAKREAAEIAQV